MRDTVYINIILYYNARSSTEHKLSIDYDRVCLASIIYQCTAIPHYVNNVKTCLYIYSLFNKLAYARVCVCVYYCKQTQRWHNIILSSPKSITVASHRIVYYNNILYITHKESDWNINIFRVVYSSYNNRLKYLPT